MKKLKKVFLAWVIGVVIVGVIFSFCVLVFFSMKNFPNATFGGLLLLLISIVSFVVYKCTE